MDEERQAKHKVLEWISKTRGQQQETPVGLPAPRNGHLSRRQGSHARPGRPEAPGQTAHPANARRPNGGAGKGAQTEPEGKTSVSQWMGLASEHWESTTKDFDLLSALKANPVADLFGVGGIGSMFNGGSNEEPGIPVVEAEHARARVPVVVLGPDGDSSHVNWLSPRVLPAAPSRVQNGSNSPRPAEPEWVLRAQQAMRKAQSLTQSSSGAGSPHPAG